MYLSHISKEKQSVTTNDPEITVRFQSPYGLMTITATKRGIHRIEFEDSKPSELMGSDDFDITQNIKSAINYICDKTGEENILLAPICSDFQFKVYQQLVKIPRGETRTYSEVAEAIGRPTAVRAVATAIARNPIAILIPCHRVVPESGGTGQYRWGSDLKSRIISSETCQV